MPGPDQNTIGHVQVATGRVVAVLNGHERVLAKGDAVHAGEDVVTGQGAVAEIRFLDDSVLAQGESSRITLNTYLFDPGRDTGNLLFKLGLGTFRLITGEIAARHPENYSLKSPLATIGIRGTTTVHTVTEQGEQHGVEDIGFGTSLVMWNEQGDLRVLTEPQRLVDMSGDGQMGDVRGFTPQDYQNYWQLSPESLDLHVSSIAADPVTPLDVPAAIPPELPALAGVLGAERAIDGQAVVAGTPSQSGEPGVPALSGMVSGDEAANAPAEQFTGWVTVLSEYVPPGDQFAINESPATINHRLGTDGDDCLYGTEGPDDLNGLYGNDRIYGLGGDDTLSGGSGRDTIFCGSGNDVVFDNTDSEHDIIYGESGNDTLVVLGGTIHSSFFGGDGVDFVDTRSAQLTVPLGVYPGSQVASDVEGVVGSSNGDTLLGFLIAYGNDGNDSLVAAPGGASLFGGAGDDVLLGEAGSDTIYGGPERDSVGGGYGDDLIFGDEGNDTLKGDYGNDTILGGEGNDYIDGVYGANSLSGDNGDDVITGGVGGDCIHGGSGDDWLDGLLGNDTVFGDDGNDVVIGSDGNDYLDGGQGNDTLWGQLGQDTIAGGDGDDRIFGGFDVLNDNDTDGDTLDGGSGNDFIDGGAGDDCIIGGSGEDILYGGSGNDILLGGDGNDILFGQEGNDYLDAGLGLYNYLGGGDGNDTLMGDSCLLNGGRGDDLLMDVQQGNPLLFTGSTANYADADGSVTVDLSAGQAWGADGNDTLVGIVATSGSGFADTLTGDSRENTIDGLGGNDLIHGGGGNDWLQSWEGSDTLFGEDGDDRLLVSANCWLNGGKGDDVLDASSVNVTADYSTADGAVYVDIGIGRAWGADGNDTLVGISNINGSEYADCLWGDSHANLIVGQGGSDTIIGSDGQDTLDGSGGSDMVWYQVAATVDLSAGSATHGGFVDSLAGFESIHSSPGDDCLIGGAGGCYYVLGEGNDTIIGGAGTDAVSYYESGSVTIDLNAGIATHGLFTDVISGVEEVLGSTGDDCILGDANANQLTGYEGNDYIDGGGGNDYLAGYEGNDTLIGGAGRDILFISNQEALSVNLMAGIATHGAYTNTVSGFEIVYGSDLGDTIIGITLDDNMLLGQGGDDWLCGGSAVGLVSESNDTLLGGDGADTLDYSNEFHGADIGVTVDLLNNVAYHGLYTDSIGGFEAVYGSFWDDSIVGSAGSDTLYGNDGNDTLIGNDGNDCLLGSYGHDYLDGGNGDDWLAGMVGNATIIGGAGVDTLDYSYSSALYVDLESGYMSRSMESDSISGVECVIGGSEDDHIIGDGGDNLLLGMYGDDVLEGAGGDDTLAGGMENDVMTGGSGADCFLYQYTTDCADNDEITDFQTGVDKVLFVGWGEFGGDLAVGGAMAGDLDPSRFALGVAAATPDERFLFDQSTHVLRYDSDGNGPNAPVIVATFQNGGTVFCDDIKVV